jgi:hypothetical protein
MNTMKRNWLMDRRTCLRGVGASLALPLLETMGWAESGLAKASKPPVRLGFMYMPHGVIPEQFWPASSESFLSEAPPRCLEPMSGVLDQCLLMRGVSGIPIAPLGGAPHALELSTWLTATLPDATRRNIVKIAISADQIAANVIGAFTALPSLELATMPQTHKENQEGLHEAYYSHCSFRSPTQAVPAETNPRNVLKRLFQTQSQASAGGDSPADPLEGRLLDLVLGGARTLRQNLGRNDQQKLDEYLDSVRSVERRIAAIEHRQKEAALEKAGVSSSKRNDSDSPPIEIKIPEGDKRSEYMRVMCDLMVLAFQTDTTRVATYIGSTPNGVSYPELGFSDEHHSQTHHNYEAYKVEKVAAITTFNIAQYAYMVKRMHQLREGEGTLLDHCILMWGSGLEDGNKHTRENLPFILAGRGGGAIRPGRFLTGLRGNQGDLLTTLLDCAGVPLDRPVGMATKQFPELREA